MLRIVYEQSNRQGAICRREWLRLSGLGGLGCALAPATVWAGAKPSTPGFGRAKAAILVFANGGQSQLDTWDPKPEAPAEVRGEFQSIESSAPGVRVCEYMPKVARQADKFTIVRSMSHDDLDHGSAAYLAFTGQFHPRKSSNPPPRPTDFPTYGAVLKRVRPNKQFPYTAVHVNAPAIVPQLVAPGQFGGFLGREYEPLIVGDVTATQVALPSLAPRDDVPTLRMDGRRTLLESLDSFRRVGDDRRTTAVNVLYQRAFEVLASDKCRQAFDLGAEPRARASATAVIARARGCCWPGGWSRPACRW